MAREMDWNIIVTIIIDMMTCVTYVIAAMVVPTVIPATPFLIEIPLSRIMAIIAKF